MDCVALAFYEAEKHPFSAFINMCNRAMKKLGFSIVVATK